MFKKIAKILVPIIICFVLYGGLITFVRCNRLEGFEVVPLVVGIHTVGDGFIV